MKKLLALLLLLASSAQSQDVPIQGRMPAWLKPIPMQAVLLMHNSVGRCSAVAITPTVALTAAHCFDKPGKNTQLLDLEGVEHDLVSYLIPDKARDEAMVQVIQPFTATATMALHAPPVADLVFVSGYGCFGSVDVRAATYLGLDAQGEMALNGSVCQGDSGGPVFNDQGQVVGLIKANTRDHIPAAWATPVQVDR